jgi:tetratricopeptide (TPR) repeat protein
VPAGGRRHTLKVSVDVMFDEEELTDDARGRAVEFFRRAYEAQLEEDYARAVEFYRRSIETYPTAEAHTFLGWVYSFEGRYTEAIDECLKAISVDETFGNPYNDIGSYLIAQGDLWTCVRWFRRALAAPRYESYAFPHFNLGRVYEERRRPLDAARHYALALEERPDFAQAAKALRRVQALLN